MSDAGCSNTAWYNGYATILPGSQTINEYCGTWNYTNTFSSPASFRMGDVDSDSGGFALDWIRVRQYASPEPSVSLGAEENSTAFSAAYSVNAGGGWSYVVSTVPATGPYVALSGAEGSTALETLTVYNLPLVQSTNTQTCGGVTPCGATNQVKFSAADMAGNVRTAGPYALIAAPPPDAGDITPARSTGAWYTTSTFTFTSDFRHAAYYRYAWDNSPSYAWTFTEPQWLASSASISMQAVSDGADYYLHAVPYNVLDSSGTSLDLGPFRSDASPPAASAFASVSSTGGLMSESQFNDLAVGVTVQLSVQDLGSGLAVATSAFSGFGVIYSKNAGASWVTDSMSLSFDGTQEYIKGMGVYNGKLYAGQQGWDTGDGDVFVFDGASWATAFDGPQRGAHSFAVYNGKLYVGMGTTSGGGDVYVYDGSSWTLSFDGSQEGVYALGVYNGKLYAGQGGGTGAGDIYVFDGASWSLSYNGAKEAFLSFAEYGGKFYAAQGYYTGSGDVYVFDGASWTLTYDGAQEGINALAVYNGKLYAGQGNGAGDGDVLVFDGAAWGTGYDGTQGYVRSLAVHNGLLYAGLAATSGMVYVYDGASWFGGAVGSQEEIYSLAEYNGNLYAGQGNGAGDGDVLKLVPLAVSTMTGSYGATSLETLSAVLTLAPSTNTQTCGGVSPCGATNQIKFFAMDTLGNLLAAGPYAVLASPEPYADDVVSSKSTATWYNTSSFTFVSAFSAASYFRYAWDASAAYTWTYAEPQWFPGALSVQAPVSGDNFYLHLLPYNVADSSGPERHIGPFLFEASSPAVSGFFTLNSTGGYMSETQFNDLAAGVTVQINVQDALSGLLVSSWGVPGEGIAPPGGFGVLYSKNAGRTWLSENMSVSMNGAREYISCLAVYNGKLYAGQGVGSASGDIFVYDGSSWTLSYDGAHEVMYALAVYNGKLYAGQGYDTGDGDVLVFDGSSWSLSYDGAQETIHSLAVYSGRLYAGQGNGSGDGDVLVYDGASWLLSYNGAQAAGYALAVYDRRLYAGQSGGDVFVFDGVVWSLNYDGPQEAIYSLAAYNGKLYAGQGSGTGDGDVLVYDGVSWAVSYDGAQQTIYSLAVYNGKLYAGQGYVTGAGDILVLNGAGWSRSYDGPQEYIYSLAAYAGKLYAGQGSTPGDGDVLAFSPVSFSTGTGADGSVGLESLSAILDLALSTNTETCAGTAGCGATNQVKFFSSDRAGNVVAAGPYAVLAAAAAVPDEIVSLKSTSSWYPNSGFTFSSGFTAAAYYRYVWDNSAGHEWTGAEDQWLPGPLQLTASSEANNWYLHVVAYNIAGSSGTDRHIGPFFFDTTPPESSDFRTFSSTGGVIGETQFNDLLAGVTMQLNVRDVLSGLAVSTYARIVEIPVLPGGFSVIYSTTAGASWGEASVSAGYNGLQETISSLAVFNGKLYAGQGNGSSDGDIYVFNGATWQKTFEGYADTVDSMAVYDGKLYAGFGNDSGEGDIYVYNGSAWTIVYDGEQSEIFALAVYNGSLYAGQGNASGAGDVLVYDGTSWSVSYDGTQEYIYSLAVYDGKLYAGQGSGTGDGDVLVFDGTAWTTSYDGAQEGITALAVYDGKLYAGQGYSAGDGDVLAYDGTSWSVSYDGTLEAVLSLAVHGGQLYAGQGYSGDIQAFEGSAWRRIYDGSQEAIYSLVPYGGALYAGQGYSAGDGDVLRVILPVISTVTGQDGSVNFELVTATASLALSTNTETCGGVSPCGATNQVRVFATDMAGNVARAGPFAVLTSVPPLAENVTPVRSTGTWYPGNPFLFTSDFREAFYYRYAWDTSATYEWTYSEPQWTSGVLSVDATEGSGRYLHVLPYNITHTSGPPRDIGPFLLDLTSPTVASYAWVSSTGGVMSETQFMQLLSGVTFQMLAQDSLSGLSNSTAAFTQSVEEGFETGALPSGFTTGGSSSWYADASYANSGIYSGRSGWIDHSQVNWMEAVKTGSAGNIQFYYRVESESCCDFLRFYVDGVQQGAWSGSVTSWTLASFAVPSGAHTYRWEYSKDGSVVSGGDAGWVDDIAFPAESVVGYLSDYSTDAGVTWYTVSNSTSANLPKLLLSGANGSQAEETFSLVSPVLKLSTNTQTCGGAAPCGATNQLKFSVRDIAGNLAVAGPYAALVSVPAVADDVTPLKSTGIWHNTSSFTFTSPFSGARYYRYAFDASASREWDYSEPQWTSGVLTATPTAGTGDWYLHLLPYDIFDSSGAARDLGPFRLEKSSPVVSGFMVYSSTGGAFTEGQFIDLASGVTVQVTVEDVISGLAVSTVAVPYGVPGYPGSFGLMFSRDAGQTWASERAAVSFNGSREIIYTLAVYNGKLYAGQGGSSGNGDVYVYNGGAWTVSYDGQQDAILALAVHDGKLYAGQGYNAGDGDVLVYDGHAWTVAYDGAQEGIYSLASYGGKLYAGQGYNAGDGDVLVYNGGSWSVSYNGAQEHILALAVYDGKLFAGQGTSSTDGDVYVFDGASWVKSFEGAQYNVYALVVHDGKLYAAQAGAAGAGDVYAFDGLSWSMSLNGVGTEVRSLAAFNGKLYAGQGLGTGYGDIFALNGSSWTPQYNGDQEEIYSLAAYNGKLYAGQGNNTGDGDILVFSPLAVSTLTGTDGTAVPQTLSSVLDLRASTNTQTCGGAVPCGATNQVRFFVTDTAGNVASAGPYAVLVSSLPAVDGVVFIPSTGIWNSGGALRADSSFYRAAYYRYALQSGPARAWDFTEPKWSTGTLSLGVPADGADWYVHLLPYAVDDSSGAPSAAGPFRYDASSSTLSSFATVNSAGILLVESQVNDLLAGVTVQVSVQDAVSGLMVSSYAAPGWGLSPGRGFRALYSTDAGRTWAADTKATVLEGTQKLVSALAVYQGRLYAGFGSATGEGDIYVYDGASWTVSYNGSASEVRSLAVYNDRLYAGFSQGGIYVYDGTAWTSSYTSALAVNAFAVYNGRLYAGQGGAAGDGKVLSYTGTSWSVAYDSGKASVYSLAAYNGRLYAGLGGSTSGDGDIHVYDGTSWQLSYDGSYYGFHCLAVYNGRLYAGQGGNSGNGDVYVYNGASWSLSRDGEDSVVHALAVAGGRLYAGQGYPRNNSTSVRAAEIYSYDGSAWSLYSQAAGFDAVMSLAAHDGRLYAGAGHFYAGDADVWAFTPVAVATMTGTDGSTALQTLSVVLNLRASTNTATCGGVAPCGATNQVRFFITDMAGNVRNGGPYAIIASTLAQADDVTASWSTGAWYNTSTVTFSSAFLGAAYYRYAWDISSTKAWDFTEPQWMPSSAAVSLQAVVQIDNWLHLLPYDIFGSSGVPRDFGPFRYEVAPPAPIGFASVDSHAASKTEAQYNDLVAGVTVQLTVQDVLAGLDLSTASKYGVKYSADAGATWVPYAWEQVYANAGYAQAMVVYGGKLHIAMGNIDGILVFDGASWSVLANDSYGVPYSLAIYNGKLYAGHGSSDVRVYDGTSWQLVYDGSYYGVYSMAVYNGKLYAGQGNSAGYGDILVYDGTSWSTTHNSSFDVVNDLVVYNGKLYAAFGNDSGEGDVYVYDGASWTVSYNTGEYNAYSLAVYAGNLYAGFQSGLVYAYNGVSWTQAFEVPGIAISMAEYGDKLYIGLSGDYGEGDVYEYGPGGLKRSFDRQWEMSFNSLGVYDNQLYAGGYHNRSTPVPGIYRLNSYAAGELTGTSGSNSPETLSLAAELSASTVTSTCGGVSPCGATNQVKFFATDAAGNLLLAGPYAVLTAPSPSAAEVQAHQSTEAWHSASTFAFSSGFRYAAYYRYAWDSLPSREWTFAETLWPRAAGPLQVQAPAPGDHYLHVLPYNVLDTTGTARDFGPFHFETSSPAAYGFNSLSSTGGVIGETQFNDLASGVTAQLLVRDLISGLAVSTGGTLAEGMEWGTLPAGWETGGNMPWYVSASDKYAGVYAARSGDLGNSQSSWLQATVPNFAGGDIRFSFKLDALNYSYLLFTLDGQTLATWQNGYYTDVSWREASFSVSPGSHTFRWTYSSGSSQTGANTAWLDAVSFGKTDFWSEYSTDGGATWAVGENTALTGTHGSTQEQVISGRFDLRASFNTQTCGGVAPCAATNQVRFSASDRAGNIAQAGPYAVIISPVPDAGDVASVRSTSTAYNTPLFTFSSFFLNAAYYRYAWTGSASYEWTYAEPQWTAGLLSLDAEAEGAANYLHILPYNIAGSSGAPRSIGPLVYETAPPTGASFATVSSTGGLLSESQPTALVSGVTVQLTVQDALAGLLVSSDGSPSEYPFPAGGFRVSYTRDSGATWSSEKTELSFQGPGYGAGPLVVYNGKLYLGHGDYYDDYEGYGDVYEFDGQAWRLSFDGDEVGIHSLGVYNGKLYAGQVGDDAGDGDIYVFDGTAWTLSADFSLYDGVVALQAYNGKLYAGMLNWTTGDIFVFDGSSWRLEASLTADGVSSFAVYNGKLFAGLGYDDSSGYGDVYVKEGSGWEVSYDSDYVAVKSLAVYNGKLYAALHGWNSGDGDIVNFNGAVWANTFEGPYSTAHSLAVYKGRLYAGLGWWDNDLEGDIYAYDGQAWRIAFDGGKVAIKNLGVYNGALYASQYGWNGNGDAEVYRLSLPVVSTMTGQDGTTAPQTLSAALDLSASASAVVCGGASPCTATNQVKFTLTDRAGNVASYGPYAVLAASAALVSDIVPLRSSGVWHNTDSFPFYSAFRAARYYRYAWDTSPSHSWTGTEQQWLSYTPVVTATAAATGTDYYFHAAAYNLFDAQGEVLDLGPFRFETTDPAAGAFASVSSTGGYMSEAQENDLALNVQVRLKVQDVLAGLSVSSAAPHGESVLPAGGYFVSYSNDAGLTWNGLRSEVSYAGVAYCISALAVYNGKLYAAQGDDDDDYNGDVYVYDGNIWTVSLDGHKVGIWCLAVYDGKLYAGQYGWAYGDGTVYVYDGTEWKGSFSHPQAVAVKALAVYNGKLYAGMYGWWDDDEGDIFVFDGVSWKMSFNGLTDGISSMAVYDGKLYAGEGFWAGAGDGDVRVFDGNSWALAYDGAAYTARSMAVYDGKLFVGFDGIAGNGDVYAYDGVSWELSLDTALEGIGSLYVYGGRLYAGLGVYDSMGAGDLYSFDGVTWRQEYDGPGAAIRGLAYFNGDLYAGEYGWDNADGRVVRLRPQAPAALTGSDGSTGEETLTASLALKASTNTETCSGAAPCGATNQVLFNFTDTAGNAVTAGPYAIISVPPISADDVTPLRSTGVWYHTSTFGFTSAQVTAAYYRYVWDNSPGYTWTYAEPVWSGQSLEMPALSSGATWYLHLLPYNALASYGAARHIGPFLYDPEPPSAFDFRTYNSTGGVITEPRFNNLLSPVTAQVSVYEALSGLSLRFYSPGQDVLSAAARGFEDGALAPQFTTGGAAPWSVTGGTVAAGYYSGRSGNIGDDQQSFLYLTADTIEGEISFYLKVDCEARYDNLRFSMDGVELSSWSGSIPWTKVSYPVTAGRHTFMWNYIKDLWDSELSDSAWIDQIELPSTATVQVQYSTSSGNVWLPVQSTVPASSPYISLTGADGTVSTQTFKIFNLPLVYSATAETCAGASACAATNQVRFFAADKAGNVKVAGPYAVLVDTAPTAPVADLALAAVYHASATVRWTAPEDIGPGMASVTTGWYRIDYATYTGYAFSSSTFKVEFSTLAVIGSSHVSALSPLWPHTTYYAMVYPGDRAYNFTQYSNLLTVPPLVPSTYCGLKMYDGEQVVSLGCEPQGTLTSPLRISRGGIVFGVILVDVADPAASRIKMQTPDGVKAVRKY